MHVHLFIHTIIKLQPSNSHNIIPAALEGSWNISVMIEGVVVSPCVKTLTSAPVVSSVWFRATWLTVAWYSAGMVSLSVHDKLDQLTIG